FPVPSKPSSEINRGRGIQLFDFLAFLDFGRSDSRYSRPRRIASSNTGSFAKMSSIFSIQGVESIFSFLLIRATLSSKFALLLFRRVHALHVLSFRTLGFHN